MNFYAHYHFFSLKNQDEFNTGLILPDFVKHSTGKKLKHLTKDLPSKFKTLQDGCFIHLETDKWFHSSDFFSQGEMEIKRMLQESGFSSSYQKAWFVGHIMLEIMLDRILIKNQDKQLRQFYDTLGAVDEALLIEFLQINEIEDTSGFIRFLNRFREAEYMFYYVEDEKLVYSLNRVCQRVGLNVFDDLNKKQLLAIIPSIEESLREKLTLLYDDLPTFSVNSGKTFI